MPFIMGRYLLSPYMVLGLSAAHRGLTGAGGSDTPAQAANGGGPGVARGMARGSLLAPAPSLERLPSFSVGEHYPEGADRSAGRHRWSRRAAAAAPDAVAAIATSANAASTADHDNGYSHDATHQLEPYMQRVYCTDSQRVSSAKAARNARETPRNHSVSETPRKRFTARDQAWIDL